MSAIAEQIPMTLTLSLVEQIALVIPHLKEATTTLEPWLMDDDVHKPATRIGQFYSEQSAFGEAEEWLLHCRAIATQRLGERHPNVATSLNNLAELYRSQGRYAAAEPLYLQAVSICYERLGEAHPNTQTGWRNFINFLVQVRQRDRTSELSDHPMTRTRREA